MMQGQDPAVTLVNGVYHLVQSAGGINLRRSSTIAGLSTAVKTTIYSPGCPSLWAPELHWMSNHWYIYYSCNDDPNHRVFVAESQSTSATGSYTDRGILFTNYWNIDGSVFNYSGQLYFICSGRETSTASQKLYIAPMSNPYTLSGPLTLLSQPDQSWERNGAVNEGPWAFQRNGRLFIVYSASGCWTDDYCLGLLTLTGTNILARTSWSKSGPVFTKQPGAYGPGHNSVVTDSAGQWWNIYHANNNPGERCSSLRRIRAQRIYWDANNMPYFGAPVPTGSIVNEDPDFLAARYELTQTSGTNAAGSGCTPPGGLVGIPVWTNPGLKFRGTNDYVDCGSKVGNDVQAALTLAAWIKPDAFVSWEGIITKGTNASPYALQLWSDGSVRFTANWGSPSAGVGSGSWNSNSKVPLGQWRHVAVTYDGATIRFYVNGVLDSYQPAVVLRFGVANEPLVLGADFPGGVEYFHGTILDARVYGRALSIEQINAIVGVNHPPTFTPVPTQAITAGQTLSITNTVTDLDIPPQNFTFSLLSGPAGASVNSSNGVFRWRPTVAQSPSTNPVALFVSDSGQPSLAATQSFQINVLRPAPPRFSAPEIVAGAFRASITGDSGPDYLVYASTNLALPGWSLMWTTNPPALPFTFTDPLGSNFVQRYFRIQLGP